MKKTILIFIIALITVSAGAFYGGMKYEQSTRQNFAKQNLGGFRQDLQNLSAEQRQQLFQGNIEGSFPRGAGRGTGSSFLNGEVIAKDDPEGEQAPYGAGQSLTLKMPDGGSKIVFFSDSTQISKTVEGSVNDVEVGKQIMVSGEQNSDGSYTAKTIQLSPHVIQLEK